jgi:aminopeptidase N
MDKWFTLQATAILPDTLDNVKKLVNNPSFSIENPNKVRALIGAFSSGNHVRFHTPDGAGYTFLASKIIELNEINPQIAARLLSPLISWRRYDQHRQKLMRAALERIAAVPNISRDVFEIVEKSR